MSEEETFSVEESLEAVTGAPESAEHNDVSQEDREAEQKKRNDAEHNWAEVRRQMREKDHEIAELRKQFASIAPRPPIEEEDELARLAKDDIITVAQAEKLAEKRARKVVEDVIKQREAATVDERMSLRHSDYTEVVSKENLEYLNETRPNLVKSLKYITDPYEQAQTAYELLKQFGRKKEKTTLERRKAEENTHKPVSVNAVTNQSAIGNAHLFENGLTKELKAQLYKEMRECSKRSA